jgi:excisionase family DNA binding protein
MPKPLLSTAETAERLGVSVSTVTRLADSGRLPIAHRMPGRTGAMLFDESDVETFAAAEPESAA